MQIVQKEQDKVLVSKSLVKNIEHEAEIKHLINLFLELFGECEILKEDLLPPIKPEIIKLNWTILPPGEYPWKKVEAHVKDIIQAQRKGNQPVIKHRIETISDQNPDFVAIGRGGFKGYLVFGFRERNLYILESTLEGNATYVFNEDWEKISQLTKKEILSENLQEDRVIHKEGWENRIKNITE